MNMIEVENLKHSFNGALTPAVDGVSFTVPKGEIFGLLGPNGAGKSTIINILVTLLKPNAGKVMVGSYEHNREQIQIRKIIGIVFQDTTLDERLTAYENLYYHAKLYHVPSAQFKERIRMALYLVNLWERRKDLVLNFSGGMKRRLEIARSIVHEPGLLFLDEPTIGLDPQTRRQIWDYVLTLNKEQGLTVLLTTHYLEEAEICHKIAVIDHGQIVALDSPGNLKKNLGGDIITLRTCDNQSIQKIIQAEFKIEVSILANELRLQVTDGTAFLTRLFHTFGKAIITVDIKKPALEDVFIHLTGKEIREQEGSTIDKVKNTVKSRWLR